MRIRSTMPLNSRALPIGRCMGTAVRPKFSCTLASARGKSARSRSSLFTTIARGSLNCSANAHTFSVCTSTPATPSTTTTEKVWAFAYLFGLHFHSGNAVHHDDRGIGGHQGAARVVNKYVVTRCIQKID